MHKYLLIIVFSILFGRLFTQVDQVDTSLRSTIIDHSDIKSYISAHALIDKRKPFYQGFRIQIFSGNSKEDAIKVKAEFYSKYPQLRCYLTYQQPYYKLRVGDFEDQESAKPIAKLLARSYPSSFLVPDEVRRVGISESSKDKD